MGLFQTAFKNAENIISRKVAKTQRYNVFVFFIFLHKIIYRDNGLVLISKGTIFFIYLA